MKLIIPVLFILTLYACSNLGEKNRQNHFERDGSLKAQNCKCRVFTDSYFNWEGPCLDGYANGIGTLTYTTSGDKFVGEVVNGRITGQGLSYSNDVLVYDGEFLDGKYNGQGTLYENNILIYDGSFFSGKKSGEGTLFFWNGNICYEGEFENDKPNGYGTMYFNSESKEIYRKGEFENGIFKLESKVNEISDDLAREVVRDVFNGGISINSSLYSASYNRDKSKVEFIINLSFNGDIIESNFYDCKIAVRNYYPELEFLQKNETVENYRTFQTILGFAAAVAIIDNELNNN